MSIDLDNPDIKAAINEAIEEATSGLVAKNKELLRKLSKQNNDPDALSKLQEENELLSAKLQEISKQERTAKTEAEKAKKLFEQESSFVNKLLVDNGLSDAVLKAGITNPAFARAAKSMLEKQVTLKTEGDARVPMIEDKPLSDYVKEWAASDDGKHFVSAPVNSGGGAAGGGKTNGGGNSITREQFDAMGQKERTSFFESGGKIN